jgi:hypothetical protein
MPHGHHLNADFLFFSAVLTAGTLVLENQAFFTSLLAKLRLKQIV